MSEIKMIAPALTNVPWQEKPEGLKGAPVWRYSENPIIGRNPIEGVARIFNSAVMPYGDEFIGVFRGEQTNGIPYIYMGRSKDAIHWDFDKEKIPFVDEEGKPFKTQKQAARAREKALKKLQAEAPPAAVPKAKNIIYYIFWFWIPPG